MLKVRRKDGYQLLSKEVRIEFGRELNGRCFSQIDCVDAGTAEGLVLVVGCGPQSRQSWEKKDEAKKGKVGK